MEAKIKQIQKLLNEGRITQAHIDQALSSISTDATNQSSLPQKPPQERLRKLLNDKRSGRTSLFAKEVKQEQKKKKQEESKTSTSTSTASSTASISTESTKERKKLKKMEAKLGQISLETYNNALSNLTNKDADTNIETDADATGATSSPSSKQKYYKRIVQLYQQQQQFSNKVDLNDLNDLLE